MRYRILMVIPELGYGGAERSFLRLADLLAESHDISIAVFKREYAVEGYSHRAEDHTHPVTVLDEGAPGGRVGRWLHRIKALRRLKKESDITISFLTGANILNNLAFSGSRTITSLRGSRLFDPAFSGFKLALYRRIIDPLSFILSDRVVSISHGLTSELGEFVGAGMRKKIVTIELFVDARKMIATAEQEIEPHIAALGDYPCIISAGRLSREKGFDHLMRVYAKVKVRIPNAKLILIGDGPYLGELLALADTLGLKVSRNEEELESSDLILLGYRKDPYRYFKVAKVFVLSSLTEGFSNTILESLAAATPVMATDCPWGPRTILWDTPPDTVTPYPTERLTEADYGILMPRIDEARYESEWVEGLAGMLEAPALTESQKERSRKRLTDFDTRTIGRKWFDLIEELS